MMLWPAIYAWLDGVLETPVVQRDQNGAIPATRPVVVVKAIAETREGHPAIGLLDANGIVRIQQGALLTVSIQSFGDTGGLAIQAVRNSLEKVTVSAANRLAGLIYVRVLAGPTDISDIIGTGYEQRYSLDVQFRTNVEILDDLGIIERVELTGEIGGYTRTEIIGVESDGP